VKRRSAFDGRKQAQPVAHRKSSGVIEVLGNVRRKRQERRLAISDRYLNRLEFPKVPKEGSERKLFGGDRCSLGLDRCSRRLMMAVNAAVLGSGVVNSCDLS
jgi:hypothetical protein